MVTFKAPIAFFLFFLLWQVMVPMEGYPILLVYYDRLPIEVMGIFSGIRLFILTITGNVSGIIAGFGSEIYTPLLIFAICVALKLVAGMLSWYDVKTLEKQNA